MLGNFFCKFFFLKNLLTFVTIYNKKLLYVVLLYKKKFNEYGAAVAKLLKKIGRYFEAKI